MSLHVSVLGAGLMGRLMALALARQGHSVSVYERSGSESQDSAAFVAAAMLAPLAESVSAEPMVARLGMVSLELWPALLATLPEPVFFQRQGTLIVWHSQDRDQAMFFNARLHVHGLEPGLASGVRELRGAEVAELEPALGSRFGRGLYLPGEGQLDNRAALLALGAALNAAGVKLYWNTPLHPAMAPGDLVVDCRGLGSKPEWAALRGVRGEALRVHSPDVALRRPVRLLHPRYPLYIVPKPDGLFVVGATEIETEDCSPVSVRSALELLSALYSVHPAFGEARILELSAQCRPALPEHLPAIRWDGGRVIRINGLYRHGWLIGPALRDAALELFQYVAEGGAGDFKTWCASRTWGGLYQLAHES